MADAGYWAIALTFLVSLYVAFASLVGQRRSDAALEESARNGVLLATVSATVAAVSLVVLLLRRDYGIRYVYEHVSNQLPIGYTLSALWAGQEGSLLLWLWLLTVFGGAVVFQRRRWPKPLGAYAVAAIALSQAFLAAVLLWSSDPFARLASVPTEGQGLNPLLQNVWMVIHPPVVFAGYAAYTVPYALALAGLLSGQMDRDWLRAVRCWALLAWALLGAGILMGAWWAYLELGWGGYWGWDPVENSSLIPWLTGTALLHSLMMQERRGSWKTWNLLLMGLTFALCNFATFVTRSGLIQSVHAFGRSVLGYYFLGFIIVCLSALGLLLVHRRRRLTSSPESPPLLSRESSLLLTNLLLAGGALIVLVGVLFPALVELLQGRQGALDRTFYERTVGPLAQAVVLSMGICPWLAWGGASPARLRRDLVPCAILGVAMAVGLYLLGIRLGIALVAFSICTFVTSSILLLFWRDASARRRSTGEHPLRVVAGLLRSSGRRYGAHIVHLGVVLIALGVTGSSLYQSEVQVTLAPGESTTIQGYTVKYVDVASQRTSLSDRVTARLEASPLGGRPTALNPSKEYYRSTQQWVTEVAIRSRLKEDLYAILAGVEADRSASLRLLVNPLVMWLWIGGGLLLAGGALAWWPSRRERSVA